VLAIFAFTLLFFSISNQFGESVKILLNGVGFDILQARSDSHLTY